MAARKTTEARHAAAAPAQVRGMVSDEAVQAKTGQPLTHWFAV